jgi:hypothetical protein
MAFETNMIAKILGLYDNELLLSHFVPGNNGKYIMRDNINNAHHLSGSLTTHPTLFNVVNCRNGHLFLNGSIKVEWEWEAGQISEAEIDAYLAEVGPTLSNFTFTKDIANNKLHVNITTDWQSDNWIDNNIKWQIASPKAKITLNSDDAEIICVTRLNGSFLKYTFMNRTIEAGETIELTRPNDAFCFLLFSDVVNSGDKNLRSKRFYKFVSETLSITNNNDHRVKIMRYAK